MSVEPTGLARAAARRLEAIATVAFIAGLILGIFAINDGGKLAVAWLVSGTLLLCTSLLLFGLRAHASIVSQR